MKEKFPTNLAEYPAAIIYNVLSHVNEYCYDKAQLIIDPIGPSTDLLFLIYDLNYDIIRKLGNKIEESCTKHIQKEIDFSEITVASIFKESVKTLTNILRKLKISVMNTVKSLERQDLPHGKLFEKICEDAQIEFMTEIYLMIINILITVHETDGIFVFDYNRQKTNMLITSENKRSSLCRQLLRNVLSYFEIFFFTNNTYLARNKKISKNHAEIFIDTLTHLYASTEESVDNIRNILVEDNSIPKNIKLMIIKTLPTNPSNFLHDFDFLRNNEHRDNYLFYGDMAAEHLMNLISSIFYMSYDY